MLPFSEACERNKDPILNVLQRIFSDRKAVLEIGSGTGQHAVHFSEQLSYLIWQPSDFGEYLPGLGARIDQYDLENLLAPIELDVRAEPFPTQKYDAVFSANSLHIMSAHAVESFFELVGAVLQDDGVLAVYGPFNYGGQYSSASNRQFDRWLENQNPESAIRDFEFVDALARKQGLVLLEDNKMPANNQCLVWQKQR